MGDRVRGAALYWATGSKDGLGTALSDRVVRDAGPGMAISCAAIALFCLCGAAAALATVRDWPAPRRRPARRVLTGLTWFGAVLLFARSIDIYLQFNLALTGLRHVPPGQQAGFLHLSRWYMFCYGPWFALGAIAWTRLAWTYTRYAAARPAGEPSARLDNGTCRRDAHATQRTGLGEPAAASTHATPGRGALARWPARTGSAPAGRALGYGALASGGFAAVHFYWAAGGRVGLDAGMAPIGARLWFLLYDIAAGLAFLAAAGVGLGLAANLVPGRWRRLLLAATFWGAVLALLRGGIGVAQDAVTLTGAGHASIAGSVYDVWFTILGVLFLLAARTLQALNRASQRQGGRTRWWQGRMTRRGAGRATIDAAQPARRRTRRPAPP